MYINKNNSCSVDNRQDDESQQVWDENKLEWLEYIDKYGPIEGQRMLMLDKLAAFYSDNEIVQENVQLAKLEQADIV